MKRVWVAVLTACLAAVFAAGAGGEEKVRLILKSARQASVYYAFAVGQAGAIMEGAPEIEVTIEESPDPWLTSRKAGSGKTSSLHPRQRSYPQQDRARVTSAKEAMKKSGVSAPSGNHHALGRPRGQRHS